MPYMLAPGARLYVGPRGQMEESLGGACCAPCAQGRPCASLGAVKFGNVVGQPSLKMLAMQNRTISGTLVPSAGGGLRGALPYIAGGAVLLVGGAMILRRNRRGGKR